MTEKVIQTKIKNTLAVLLKICSCRIHMNKKIDIYLKENIQVNFINNINNIFDTSYSTTDIQSFSTLNELKTDILNRINS